MVQQYSVNLENYLNSDNLFIYFLSILNVALMFFEVHNFLSQLTVSFITDVTYTDFCADVGYNGILKLCS